jgi:hypothetical protein
LRDLIADPFRPTPAIAPAWLAWNGGTVRRLAEAVYDGRAFDRLPVLADALEDTGCGDAEILTTAVRVGNTSAVVGWSTCCSGKPEPVPDGNPVTLAFRVSAPVGAAARGVSPWIPRRQKWFEPR